MTPQNRSSATENAFTRFVLDHLPDPVLVLDARGALIEHNRAAAEFDGFNLTSLFGGGTPDESIDGFLAELRANGRARRELPARRPDPALRYALVGFTLDDCLMVMVRNLSDSALLEQELRQYRRVRTLGLVTARLAHDLNNLLTPILLYSRELADASPPRESLGLVRELESAALRAVALVKDILEFARPRTADAEVLSVNATISALRSLMALMLGKSVALSLSLDERPTYVRVNRAQLEQALLNLVSNAKTAMPHGGDLRITTANVVVGQDNNGGDGLSSYVVIVVNDTGIGMTDDVRARAFDDFFTTRAARGGTGLGLGCVRQFVKESGGLISLESEVGRGTSVIMHLPRAEREPARTPPMPRKR